VEKPYHGAWPLGVCGNRPRRHPTKHGKEFASLHVPAPKHGGKLLAANAGY